jgi:hypothetical protein
MQVKVVFFSFFILFSCKGQEEQKPKFEPPYFNLDLDTEILDNNCSMNYDSELVAVYFQSNLVHERISSIEYSSKNRSRYRVDSFLSPGFYKFGFECSPYYYDNFNFVDDSLTNRIQMIISLRKIKGEFNFEVLKKSLEKRIMQEPENYDIEFRFKGFHFQDFNKQGYPGFLCRTIYAHGKDTIKNSIFYWNLKTYYLVGKMSFYNSSDSLQDKETYQILNSLWVHRKKNGKGYPLN